MNLADGIILCVIALSALIGLWRGFVREAFSLVTWVLAFVVASLFYPGMAQLLAGQIPTPSIRIAVAFVILFIITLFIGGLVVRLLNELIRITGLSGTDRALGAVFGLLRGAILVIVLVALGQPLLQGDGWWQASALVPHFLALQQGLWSISGQLVAWVMGLAGRA